MGQVQMEHPPNRRRCSANPSSGVVRRGWLLLWSTQFRFLRFEGLSVTFSEGTLFEEETVPFRQARMEIRTRLRQSNPILERPLASWPSLADGLAEAFARVASDASQVRQTVSTHGAKVPSYSKCKPLSLECKIADPLTHPKPEVCQHHRHSKGPLPRKKACRQIDHR